MWFSLILLCASAFANGDTFVKPERTTTVEQEAVDQYVTFFDRVLVRKLGRKMLKNQTLELEDPGDFLSGAASEAAMDWSFWALRRLPTPTLSLPSPQRRSNSNTHNGQVAQGQARSPSPDGSQPRSFKPPPKRRPASLNLGVSPRLPPAGSDRPIDATVLANGRGFGLSAWRLSSEPIAKTWSVWMRRDLIRGFSLVASADSAPKQPELGGLSGGAILKVPGESWRVYAHYDHAPSRKLTEPEHKVALTLSMSPNDRRAVGAKRRAKRPRTP